MNQLPLLKAKSKINWPAVRAFLRASRAMYGRQELDRRADHAICPDGYGVTALEHLHLLEEQRLSSRIAVPFGMTGRMLMDHVWAASHIQEDCIFEALRIRRATRASELPGYLTLKSALLAARKGASI